MFVGGISIFTLAMIVWAIGYFTSDVVPTTGWCFVMMICCAVMSVGNLLGILSGQPWSMLVSAIFLFFTLPGTVHYYRLWKIRRRGW